MKHLQILTNIRNALKRFLRIHIVSTSYIDIWIHFYDEGEFMHPDYCYKTKVQVLPRKGDVFWTNDKIVLALEKELMKKNDWPEKWTWHKGEENQYVSFDDAIYVKEILFMDNDKSIHLTLNDSI
jgi:hypothetical protein